MEGTFEHHCTLHLFAFYPFRCVEATIMPRVRLRHAESASASAAFRGRSLAEMDLYLKD